MDRRTADSYRERAEAWIAARRPQEFKLERLGKMAAELTPGSCVADLGCGPGWYAERFRELGMKTVAVDVSAQMLAQAQQLSPANRRVLADLAALPLRRGALQAAWAINSYQHLPLSELPGALAHLHAALMTGAPFAITLTRADALQPTDEEKSDGCVERVHDDEFGSRLFTGLGREQVTLLFESAGFEDVKIETPGGREFWWWISGRRRHTLPDYVRPDLDLLVCGLNPSPHAAETGVPFGRPGNRFWPAARAAGLVTRDRDPFSALREGVGFTDLVKRTTPAADALSREEYTHGIARLEKLVRVCRPRVICFVGLDGWRRSVDRSAAPGPVPGGFAGCKAYLMPSTSGRNAHSDLDGLTRHLRAASR